MISCFSAFSWKENFKCSLIRFNWNQQNFIWEENNYHIHCIIVVLGIECHCFGSCHHTSQHDNLPASVKEIPHNSVAPHVGGNESNFSGWFTVWSKGHVILANITRAPGALSSKSSHCNSLQDRVPIDFSYRCQNMRFYISCFGTVVVL